VVSRVDALRRNNKKPGIAGLFIGVDRKGWRQAVAA
jgi:hypothetical protein